MSTWPPPDGLHIWDAGQVTLTLTPDGAVLPDGTTRPLTEDEAASVAAWQAQQAAETERADAMTRIAAALATLKPIIDALPAVDPVSRAVISIGHVVEDIAALLPEVDR